MQHCRAAVKTAAGGEKLFMMGVENGFNSITGAVPEKLIAF
jgi:hypothetical protein